MIQKWEYNTATRYLLGGGWDWEEPQLKGMTIFQALDSIGAEGWELVDSTALSEHGTTNEIHYLFKRPIS
ncbi:MAG TPA: hypothetical protein VM657_05200 [Sphingomonas sp.]|nr:hypothetical protein [Sphingomonas sp.]